MKGIIAVLMMLIIVVINGEDELKFTDFFMFQNNSMSIKNKTGEYNSRYLDMKISDYRYNEKEDGELKIYMPELKIKTKYINVYGCAVNFDADKIKLFGEDISIENQMFFYVKTEGKSRIGDTILKYGIGYGNGDIKLKSNIADGTFENIKIINGDISLRRKNINIDYKTGVFKSDLVINKDSNMGNLKIDYNYGKISYKKTGVWYLKIKSDGFYNFDFLTVGALAFAEQNYFNMNGEFDIYGVTYENRIKKNNLEINIFATVGSLRSNNSKINMKRIKKHIFEASETEIREYNIKTDMPVFFYGSGEIAYNINTNFKIGIKKKIPYISGVEIEKNKIKNGVAEDSKENSGTGKKNKMDSSDYLISGTMLYISIYY